MRVRVPGDTDRRAGREQLSRDGSAARRRDRARRRRHGRRLERGACPSRRRSGHSCPRNTRYASATWTAGSRRELRDMSEPKSRIPTDFSQVELGPVEQRPADPEELRETLVAAAAQAEAEGEGFDPAGWQTPEGIQVAPAYTSAA